MLKTSTHARTAKVLAVAGLGLLLPFGAAMATDYVVDTDADGIDDTDGLISLREAIMAANTDTAVGDAPAGEADGDTISFDAGNPITGGGIDSITLLSPLQISDDVSITGNADILSGTTTTITGGDAAQLFVVDASAGAGETTAVSFTDLMLTEALAASGAALQIAAGSNVTLTDVDVTDSVTTGGDAGMGGAVFNDGSLTISGGTFSGNAASGMAGSGGALLSNGMLTVSDTSFENNTANRAGGAVELGGSSSSSFFFSLIFCTSSGTVIPCLSNPSCCSCNSSSSFLRSSAWLSSSVGSAMWKWSGG